MSTQAAEKKKPSWLAQKLLGLTEQQASVLPPDKWIFKNTFNVLRKHKGLRKDTKALAFYGTICVATIGVAGAIFVGAMPIAAGLAVTYGALTAATSLVFGALCVDRIGMMKKHLPDIKKSIASAFLGYKGKEIKSAWKKNIKESRKENENKKDPVKKQEEPKKIISKKKTGFLKSLFKSKSDQTQKKDKTVEKIPDQVIDKQPKNDKKPPSSPPKKSK